MPSKLGPEARMVIKELEARGTPHVEVARLLNVTEGAVRYHARRQREGAVDGRSKQVSKAAALNGVIAAYVGSERRPNLAALHEFLVAEHAFKGSLRALQRYVRRQFAAPPVRARRRVETPPGAQAQADWGHYAGVVVGGERVDLVAFYFQLSHSRYAVAVWSARRDELAWLHVHNGALRRIGGVPATVRVDNEKTAVSQGAGVFGVINPVYRRYAQAARFHVDACAPRSPEAKGKIERRILDGRLRLDVLGRDWSSIDELQAATDERMIESARRRTCPATGTTVLEAFEQERPFLGTLPELPEPFDIAVTRTVAPDCTVPFESRSYSVPFRFLGRAVEVRGCSGTVQILADGAVVATHPRHTKELILIDVGHYEGERTPRVLPPLPLGRMGRRLQEIASMTPEQRPVDLYAALAEVAR